MDNKQIAMDCLAASLTLLHYHNIVSESSTINALNENGYEGLFKLLNDTFGKLNITEEDNL